MENDRNIPPTIAASSMNTPTISTSSLTASCSNDLNELNLQQQQQQYLAFSNNHQHNGFTNGNGININGVAANREGDLFQNLNGINHNNNHHNTRNSKKYSRNINSSGSQNSSQANLNDWLENCLRDQQSNYTASTELYDSPTITNYPQMMNNGPKLNINTHIPITNRPNFSTPHYVENYFNPNNSLQKSLQLLEMTMGSNNNEFTSLPPGIDLLNSRPQHIDPTETNGFQDLLNVDCNQSRRFSDPGFGANSDENESKDSNEALKQNDQSNGGGMENKLENSKLLTTLLEQINLLHETNSKICRNLHETKVEIEALKHAPSWGLGLRHRRDSISGLSTHSQPLGYNNNNHNNNFGTQSPAPTYHSGMYTPGMLTDVVREVREAARIREEAVLNRVKTLVDERSWTLNEKNFRLMRDVEDLKAQIHQLKSDRKDTNQRINHMETEIKSLKSLLTHTINLPRNHNPFNFYQYPNPNDRDFNNQTIPTTRQQQSATAPTNRSSSKRNNALNYGVVHHDDGIPLQTVKENEIIKRIGNNNPDDLVNSSNLNIYPTSPNRHNNIHNEDEHYINVTTEQSQLNKSFNSEGQISQLEKDNLVLRRELQNAKAATNNSEYRIKTLEQIVTSLQNSMQIKNSENSTQQTITTTNSNNSNLLNGNDPSSILKIIENTRLQNLTSAAEPQIAIQVQEVTPTVGNRKSDRMCLSGPVTDL